MKVNLLLWSGNECWVFRHVLSGRTDASCMCVSGCQATRHLPRIGCMAKLPCGFFSFGRGITMKQRLLVSSIIMGLCASMSLSSAWAQSAGDQSEGKEKKKETTELQGVVVTGSLIPRAQIETASPTITITNQEIEKQGFKNVYDALRSLPIAVGQVQDSQNTNTFTPAANTVSLLGLDPSFTLVLMNGKPLADYPF